MWQSAILPAVILLGMLVFSGCGNKAEPTAADVQETRVPVSLSTVQRGEIKEIRTYYGRVSSRGLLQVVSEVPGRITFIVDEGEVRAGEVLARIESEELSWQLAQAEAVLEMAKLDLEMLISGPQSEELTIARAAVDAAQAALEGAEWAYETAVKNFLDRPQLRAQVEAAQSQYALALQNLEMAKVRLDEVKNSPDKDTKELAKLGVESAEEQYKLAVRTLELLKEQRDDLQECIEDSEEPVRSMLEMQLDALETQIETAESQVRLAEIALRQAEIRQEMAEKGASQYQIRAAELAVYAAEAQMYGAERQLEIARKELREGRLEKSQLDAATVRKKAAEADLEMSRARLTALERGATEEQIELAKARVRQAEAAFNLARLQLDKTVIRAPRSGKVLSVSAARGQTVGPGTALLTLLAEEKQVVTVQVPVADIDKISSGQPAVIRAGDKVFYGTVLGMFDYSTSGYVPVQVAVDESAERLTPGVYVSADIVIAHEPHALLIPEEALVERSDGYYVYVLKLDSGADKKSLKARLYPVSIGIRQKGTVQVVDGLDEGDKVVAAGKEFLTDGSSLRIIPR